MTVLGDECNILDSIAPERMEPPTSVRVGLSTLTNRTLEGGGIFEVTLLKTTKGTVCGYFDNLETAVIALGALPPVLQPEGVYVTLNPISPELLARAVNRFEPYAKTRAGNTDVLRRLWLPIDADPVRPAGISATNEELAMAVALTDAVVAWLAEFGWPVPVRACAAFGLPNATWLTFRRTYSSWSHDTGVPAKVIAHLMGHAKVDTTLNIYTQVIDGALRAGVEKVGNELFRIVQSPVGSSALTH
jgi:hypothetical protein